MAGIAVGDYVLDYERSGSGPPLLMIMGMSGTQLTWGEPFLELLREDFELITYDHRGVGASSRLEGPITIAEMAADAAGLLAALEIESAHVLGISMGGMIAQELALARPSLIRTLTLGCTSCGGPTAAHIDESVFRRMGEARRSGDRELAIQISWEINVSPTFAADLPARQRFAEVAVARPVAAAVIQRQREAIAAHDTCARLGTIELPTLIVHGTVDRLLPVSNGEAIAERMTGAAVELFDDVGHLFFWERPERSAELVRSHAAVHA